MSRTFVRQDTQIRSSDAYVDGTAPTEAAFETNPTNIETDLNNIRSQLHNLLKNHAGNWYDDLNIPATLETGVERGVNDLNAGLHAVEKKRILRDVHSLVDIVPTASVASTGTLTGTANFADTETVTIDAKVYTFQATLTDVDGNVFIGVDLATSLDNLRAAINLDAGAGSAYAASMTLHPTVSATDTATTVDVTAKTPGAAGDTIASTETATNASWGGATLSGGSDGDNFVVLGVGELPSNLTAAVGAVTTLGTVVAEHTGTFGTHSLDEVAGPIALSPKNLCLIVDGDTRDPILSSSRKIWGLLQSESGTDEHTIDTSANEVQISFVRHNASGDDLEAVPFGDIAGKTINYCYRERVRLEDLTETDFLRGAVVDVGAGAGTIDLQSAIDNQGSTPVDVTTDVDIDLEGPGLQWCWRDNLEADLFCIIEGSAGGTSEIAISSDVDIFDVDAVVNDFENGASFDTGAAGTTINIGTTPNQIDSGGNLTIASGGSGDLTLDGSTGDVIFSDENYAGSTYDTPLNLSDTSAEWDAFELAFGEVSLLNAITQAATAENRSKTVAVVTSTTSADTDVGGSGGGTNLDAQLGDYSSVTFVDDVDIFLNGVLMRNGAGSGDDHDVYPGTSAALGQLMFEFTVKAGGNPDVITMIIYGV